jgi:hypothetical protein
MAYIEERIVVELAARLNRRVTARPDIYCMKRCIATVHNHKNPTVAESIGNCNFVVEVRSRIEFVEFQRSHTVAP